MDPLLVKFQTCAKPAPKDIMVPQPHSLLVSTLINPVTRQWNTSSLAATFDAVSIAPIKKLQPATVGHSNKFIWAPDRKGSFTIKSACNFTLGTQNSL